MITTRSGYAGHPTGFFLEPYFLALALCVMLLASGCGDGNSSTSTKSASTGTALTLQPSYADVVYAPTSAQQRLDLYLPTQRTTPSPVVIWIHGGAFTVGDKRVITNNNLSSPPQAAIVPANGGPLTVSQIQVPDVAVLIAKGYAVVSINYRLAVSIQSFQDYTTAVRQATQDAKAAIRFLRANATKYSLDPDKFATWGDSAGGFIASMLGATGDQSTIFDDPALGNADVSSAVQAVVDWFGPIDPATDSVQRATTAACAYMDAQPPFPDNLVALAQQYSPLAYIPKATLLPRFMIAHGNADCAVPAAQSQELYAALNMAHATVTLNILPGAGHEDPMFMTTQMIPTFAFLDATFRMSP